MRALILLFISIFSHSLMANLYLEIDPFAYGLKGHSLHIGSQGYGFRLQIGIFAAELPDSFKNNTQFNVSQGGMGIKVDYYGKDSKGSFIGIEYGKTSADYQLTSGGQIQQQTIDFIGIRTGYKIAFTQSAFITPWIGLNKNISNTPDTHIDEQTYYSDNWTLFPTIHLGFEF